VTTPSPRTCSSSETCSLARSQLPFRVLLRDPVIAAAPRGLRAQRFEPFDWGRHRGRG